MNKLKIDVEEYIRDTLGIQVVLDPWKQSTRLPLYLRDRYSFFTASVLENTCLFMIDESDEEETPAAITRHLIKVGDLCDTGVVYVRPAVSSYNRKRLIEQKVPFIVPGNQMYLPLLGIDFRERLKQLREKKKAFSPATQALVLHVMYGKPGDTITPTAAADQLGYTVMTMSRAFNELAAAAIGKQVTRGKERHLRFPETGKPLWEGASPYLTTPVKKRLYVAALSRENGTVLAGESALAHYTMLADPKVSVYAFSASGWKRRLQQENITVIPHTEPGTVEIEIWKYDPVCFAKAGVADRLSLYLSLKDTADERVQSALETLLGGMA